MGTRGLEGRLRDTTARGGESRLGMGTIAVDG
jgi:hypothetical protein